MQRNDPSQFVGQLQDQIYPAINDLQNEKSQMLGRTKAKRKINEAVSHFETGLDLINDVFIGKVQKKKLRQEQNGRTERTSSHRSRQPEGQYS